ncbi:MAG TPA: hypothetical protein VGO62_05635, partial [Myxococcota bacterium]
MRIACLAVVAVVVVGALVGCQFNTDRTKGLVDGEITGTAKRADGSVAKGAVVAVAGSDRVVSVDDKGAFRVQSLVPGTWILHITEDEDGDGVPERAAFAVVPVKFAPVPKNLTDGITGKPPNALTSTLLGDVVLADTSSIKGTVAVAVGEFARVVAWRDESNHAAPIEASSGVDVNGAFDLEGVAPGAVHLAALTYSTAGDVHALSLQHFGVADASAGDAAVHITPDQSARVASDATKLRTQSVQIDAQWSSQTIASVQLALATYLEPSDDSGTPISDDSTGATLDA